jgi:uncharacterized protein (TIGR02421 family)
MSKTMTPLAEADRRLVKVAKDIHILRMIGWPAEIAERFFASKTRELPKPPVVQADLRQEAEALEELSEPVSSHPAADFIAKTARSFLATVRMLQSAGTPDFTAYSCEVYGRPSDPVAPGGLTNLEAAEYFLAATEDLQASCFIDEADLCLTPAHVQSEMSRRCAEMFTEHEVSVVLDPNMVSKAAAGAERIRLRSGTCFTPADLEQLWYHEACVHTATALNGREQEKLTCLSLGAPRTTATQEGLATFSELITNAIDLPRLRRVALRVKAIHMALEGGDFFDVLDFFRGAGQTDKESFFSTARIFRGGDPRGGVPFTKDGVYLRGVLEVHAFLHAAIASRRIELMHYVFAGRMACGDVMSLAPLFEDGTIAPPLYEPEWLKNRNQLAAYLAFSDLTHNLPMHELKLESFRDVTRPFDPRELKRRLAEGKEQLKKKAKNKKTESQ